jgi:hypothetical protein
MPFTVLARGGKEVEAEERERESSSIFGFRTADVPWAASARLRPPKDRSGPGPEERAVITGLTSVWREMGEAAPGFRVQTRV